MFLFLYGLPLLLHGVVRDPSARGALRILIGLFAVLHGIVLALLGVLSFDEPTLLGRAGWLAGVPAAVVAWCVWRDDVEARERA